MHRLYMARFFTFEPQFVARPAEINSPSQFSRLLQGFAVHPSKHQHIVAAHLDRGVGHVEREAGDGDPPRRTRGPHAHLQAVAAADQRQRIGLDVELGRVGRGAGGERGDERQDDGGAMHPASVAAIGRGRDGPGGLLPARPACG